jgi:hypothetical protein
MLAPQQSARNELNPNSGVPFSQTASIVFSSNNPPLEFVFRFLPIASSPIVLRIECGELALDMITKAKALI